MIYLFFLHGVNCLLHHHHRVRGIRHGVGLRRRGGAPQGPFHCTNLRWQGDPGFSVCCQVWRGWVPGFHIVDKHIVLVDNSFLKTEFFLETLYKQLIEKYILLKMVTCCFFLINRNRMMNRKKVNSNHFELNKTFDKK